jgi:chemotaxis methyl-accepting protein methylase
MSAALEQVAELIRRETGISLLGDRLAALEAGLKRVAPRMNASEFLRRRLDPIAGPGLTERLIDEVTIKETFMFRQRQELDAIDWQGLLETASAAGSDRVRVWVAACASGEEAVSLAILASEALARSKRPVSILATDISKGALTAGRRGVYGRRSLRAVPGPARERYFTRDGDQVAVCEQVRRMVDFRHHNLVRDPIPPFGEGPFDLIACRNVLIYFDGATVERVIGALERALSPQGTLVLGAADRLCGSARTLARINASPPQRRRRARHRTLGRGLRRPLGRQPAAALSPPARGTEPRPLRAELGEALRAANEGDLAAAIEETGQMLQRNPLDADAYFVRGLAELGLGDAAEAIASFRRALYVDPSFGLAAFQLGRAQEACGYDDAAARAYHHALRVLEPGDARHAELLDQVDIGDVAAACSIRARALAPSPPRGRSTSGAGGVA